MSEVPANQDFAREADNYPELIGKCRAQIHQKLGETLPKLALVLGSGFQEVLRGVHILAETDFGALPGFPQTTVAGHSGKLLLALLDELPCLVCSGRAHFYEGLSMEAVMFPVRMLAACGVTELALTNAAGGINRLYRPGDLMLFTDHINFTGVNPLRAPGVPARFLDLTQACSPSLRREFLRAAARAKIKLHSGVYLGVSGPSYETPAEIRAFRKLGADAVGMSAIPEVLMARACGLSVAAISCITNPAAGLRRAALSHEEVLRVSRQNADSALRLLAAFARARAGRKDLKINARPVGSKGKRR